MILKLNIKVCSKCQISKDISEFNYCKRTKDQYACWCRLCEKDYRIKNKEAIYKIKQEYYKRNKEIISIVNADYRLNNKSKKALQSKNWYLKNKSSIINRVYNYKKKRLKSDINFKVIENLRRRLNHALHGRTKSASTLTLLGCSIDDLKLHLESKFDNNMSWSNYGQWHIDHIIPCSKFDVTRIEEQQRCFHYSNLQPLWALDNIRKSNNTYG